MNELLIRGDIIQLGIYIQNYALPIQMTRLYEVKAFIPSIVGELRKWKIYNAFAVAATNFQIVYELYHDQTANDYFIVVRETRKIYPKTGIVKI